MEQIIESGTLSAGRYIQHSSPALPTYRHTFGSAVVSTGVLRQLGPDRILVPYLSRHLQRLESNAKQHFGRGPVVDVADVEKTVAAIGQRHLMPNSLATLKIQFVATGDQLQLLCSAYQNPWQHVELLRLCSVAQQRSIPHLKLVADPVSIKARSFAIEQGSHEALLTSSSGIPSEGAWSNFFWISKDDTLFTPATQLLPGIVRSLIIENFPCQCADIPLTEICRSAKTAFITQATSGVSIVGSIDTYRFPGEDSELLRKIQSFLLAIERENPW